MKESVRAAAARPSAGRGCYCLLLALPALVFAGILLYQHQVSLRRVLLLIGCLLLYLVLVAAALMEGMIRPLQTLSNVVSSLREGDYSFRARGAGVGRMRLANWPAEVNALADLLQKQRVRSLEATALLARILEVMHAPLFAFDRNDRLQLVNNAGAEVAGPAVCALLRPQLRANLAWKICWLRPTRAIHSFGRKVRRAGCCARRSFARMARRTLCCCWPT